MRTGSRTNCIISMVTESGRNGHETVAGGASNAFARWLHHRYAPVPSNRHWLGTSYLAEQYFVVSYVYCLVGLPTRNYGCKRQKIIHSHAAHVPLLTSLLSNKHQKHSTSRLKQEKLHCKSCTTSSTPC